MNYPFIEGISDIVETDAPSDSRATILLSSQWNHLQSCSLFTN
jgi:hypothetical protein